MLPKSQEVGHELYNLGHLLQGAIAYYRATGDRTLLDAGIRFVDGYLLQNFGPGADKKPILSGHPEMEMALIELYRTMGDKRHLELAGYILQGDERIKRRPTPAERVGHPNPRKAASFDLPGILDDAMERTAARLPLRPHKGHNAQSHDHPPGENFAVTKSSSLTDR